MSRILITGICGFAGSVIARQLLNAREGLKICGIDNLCRPGSETNLESLRELGVEVHIGDVRNAADLAACGDADWLIDAAANPSVLAGVDGRTTSKELIEHNLYGTVEMLEYCRIRQIPFTLLSTSRVYSIAELLKVPMKTVGETFAPDLASGESITGVGLAGLTESYSTDPPVSLYGSSKRCSELLALEYGATFNFPVWINRCGVLAGAGQFGKADQGIFSFWIHSWASGKPLKYLGFEGSGRQVRDCLHPADLVPLLLSQFDHAEKGGKPAIVNVAGSAENSMSLAQLSEWCTSRFGSHEVIRDGSERPFDLPWVVLDSSLCQREWNWAPRRRLTQVLDEIADHAIANPHWLELVTA